jgi:hypothetical protein
VCEPDDGNTAKPINTDKCNDLLKRWERFRDASQYENQRMHDRFNWLMISQPVLFTALAFAVKEHKDCSLQGSVQAECPVLDQVEWLTIWLGLTISLLAFVGLAAAGRKHWQWTSRLNTLASELNANKESDPTVPFGLEPHWPARTTSLIAPAIASTFVFAWMSLTLTLTDWPVFWSIFGVDFIMLLSVLLVSGFIPAQEWFHRWRAWMKST